MPKTEIDYSNTIIYKITCKDPEIKDVYVGHTTNFVQRKHAHKNGCINPKSSNYDCKLYNTIRDKGGWTNWRMEILNFFNCFDHYEARQKEQEYFISLNANLNSIEPMPKPKPRVNNINEDVNVNICTNVEPIMQQDMFVCKKCEFTCKKLSNWNTHLLTSKHKTIQTHTKIIHENANTYHCVCGKSYGYSSNFYTHRKKCTVVNTKKQDDNILITLVSEIVNNNKEFQKQHIDLQKQVNDLHKQNIELQTLLHQKL